jgi:hypothetical protein
MHPSSRQRGQPSNTLSPHQTTCPDKASSHPARSVATQPCTQTPESIDAPSAPAHHLPWHGLYTHGVEGRAAVLPRPCGPSPLLNLIGCLDTPTSGCFQVAGVDVTRRNPWQAAAFRGEHLGCTKEDTPVKCFRWMLSVTLAWLLPGTVCAQRPPSDWGWEHPMGWMWGARGGSGWGCSCWWSGVP